MHELLYIMIELVYVVIKLVLYSTIHTLNQKPGSAFYQEMSECEVCLSTTHQKGHLLIHMNQYYYCSLPLALLVEFLILLWIWSKWHQHLNTNFTKFTVAAVTYGTNITNLSLLWPTAPTLLILPSLPTLPCRAGYSKLQ